MSKATRRRYRLRPLRHRDNAAVAKVIQKVMPEFGAKGPGFALSDPEVSDMFASYRKPRSAYFVVTWGGRVLGVGGIAPLAGGGPHTCELRKMYFLPQLRGLGFGHALMEVCLAAARRYRFKTCYLETLNSMKQARALYVSCGFRQLSKPRGGTGHFGCDAWYAKRL